MDENQKLGSNGESPLREVVLDHGVQPLDALMTSLSLSNTSLVAARPELHLTHKMIGKGRRGRRLSRKVQQKVLEALNVASKKIEAGEEGVGYRHDDLFTYDGR